MEDVNMKGKELIRKAFFRENLERIPWVPFVGCHAATFLNVTATEFLKSRELIVEGVGKAVEAYHPDGIPVAFDLQVEAEALGCKLNWSDENPPAVVSHPLMEGKSLEDLALPGPGDARIPMVMEAAKELRENHPDIALYGLITGPFTLALHLMGTDIFMKMLEEPDVVIKLMEFTSEVATFMADQYLDAGCDVIALVDPMTSQIDPGSFGMFVSPPVTEIFDHIRERGGLSSFFVCGNAQQNIEVMCKCKPDNVSIDENIPLDFVRDIALANDVSFGGNIKLTVVLLMGTEEDSQREALECMDTGGRKGFVLAPGCDLPMATPQENIRAITQLVHDEELQGSLRASEAVKEDIEPLDLSSHWKDDQVVIDIVTLDSSSCAPCQYMVNAVERASEFFGSKVSFREHRIKEKEGVQMMASLGVMKIPTIVMDGEVKFVSKIPPIQEIKEEISGIIKARGL